MKVSYNENDPFVARWLRNLILEGHLPSGVVDTRSITYVDSVTDTQHFFAGIGGWPIALQLAKWPDDIPVWTGSCPCQPFSMSGKQKGFNDKRHLWPAWFRLITQYRPPFVFGEQVTSPHAKHWLDTVFDDLEGAGYTCWAANLCASGVGAPHIRQRLYWVAYTPGKRLEEFNAQLRKRGSDKALPETTRDGAVVLAGDTRGAGLEGRPLLSERPDKQHTISGSTAPWIPVQYIRGSDGKSRPVEPGTFPLAHGIPQRVGRLRAYGNAIVPQVAATFVASVMDVLFGELT